MTKQEAQAEGAKLLARMKTPGWRLRTWENMGWHFAVYNGNLQVYPAMPEGKYFAGLGADPRFLSWNIRPKGMYPAGTPAFWSCTETFSNPNKAVAAQVKRARAFVSQLELVVIDSESLIKQGEK